ncbi:MAG: PilZ domain-containing protein [Deltaproteobacteria bacterium]|nr:PilZ domain-containing protein [Deltaproteobacteria bacterium]
MLDDRRDSARSPLFMLVHTPAGAPLWAWDIGLSGMLCRSRILRTPGTYLDLRFRLPGTHDELKAGAQVMTLDQVEEELSLGVRFCMLSAMAQRAIYRFLDHRRVLWESKSDARPQARDVALPLLSELVSGLDEPPAVPAAEEQPFEKLLLEAYASMRAKELQRLAFIRAPACLPRLSALAGRP